MYEDADDVFYCPKCGRVTYRAVLVGEKCLTCRDQKMIYTGHDADYYYNKYRKENGTNDIINCDLKEMVREEFFYGNPNYSQKDVDRRKEVDDRCLKKVLKEKQQIQNIPHCPTCGSTDIEKIGTGNKVASALAFGIFSLGHISKTFKCKQCGYKW